MRDNAAPTQQITADHCQKGEETMRMLSRMLIPILLLLQAQDTPDKSDNLNSHKLTQCNKIHLPVKFLKYLN